MVLELYVWGPAFGLPSIDPQCLATIAYFSQALPLRDEWILIPDSDPAVSPTNELPALKNRETWVTGFASIVDYLKKYSASHWDLDLELNAQQKADTIAFSSFVESRAQTLSDLLFYVSSENYASATRASYGEILYWPKAWTLPSKIRAKAIKRSEHLGLSSLDVDFASAQEESQKTRKSDDLPRGLIARPRDTVISLLGTPTRRNQFRLDALTSELFEPLDTLLAEKGFLLSDSTPSSLDCLVIGYLSPILWATLPQEWMKRSLRSDYPPLAKYVQRFSNQCFGSPVSPSAVLQGRHNHGSAEGLHLPWQASEEPSTLLRGGQMFECILDTIPGVDHLRARKSLRNTATKIDENAVRQRRANSQKLYRQAVAVSVGFSAFVGYLVWGGVLQMSTDESGSVGRKSFGPAGAMLGLSRD